MKRQLFPNRRIKFAGTISHKGIELDVTCTYIPGSPATYHDPAEPVELDDIHIDAIRDADGDGFDGIGVLIDCLPSESELEALIIENIENGIDDYDGTEDYYDSRERHG